MTRHEHLKFCRACTHQKKDPNRGIHCNLTDEIEDFRDTCTLMSSIKAGTTGAPERVGLQRDTLIRQVRGSGLPILSLIGLCCYFSV